MSKRKRESSSGAGGGADEDFFGAPSSAAAPKKGAGSKRTSGRLKTLSQSFRTLDEETRRSILKARLDALEADNHGEEGAGGLGDDEEFYVDDEGTEKKSRAGSSSSGMTGGGKKGGGAGGDAAAMKRFSEKRARIMTFAETVASELGLGMEAADVSTGAFDLAKARAIAVAAKKGERKLKATTAAAGSSSSSSSSSSDGKPPIPGAQAYLLTAAGPSLCPGRPHCSVCGMKGPYSCTRCGARFCSSRCGAQHKETRCLISGGGS